MLRRAIAREKGLRFVVIYTREPHARQLAFKEIGQPIDWNERRDLAERTRKELKLDVLFLVDEMGDPSRKLFGDVPNPAIFVGRDGTIADKLAWAEASEVKRFLKEWSAATAQEKEGPESRPTSRPTREATPTGRSIPDGCGASTTPARRSERQDDGVSSGRSRVRVR